MAGSPIKRERRERCAKLIADPEWWDEVFEFMGQGNGLSVFCQKLDIPYMTVFDAIQRDDELKIRYEAARRRRALYNADRIEKMAEDVESGDLDAKAGQVAIEARMWLSSRMDPHHFGDRIMQDIRVTDATKLHLEAVRALAQRVRVIPARTAAQPASEAQATSPEALPHLPPDRLLDGLTGGHSIIDAECVEIPTPTTTDGQ
jgi:hypothetical protein